MFLKLLAEHKGVNASKFRFIDYWTKIPDLTLKESMRNLNARRINMKHKGLLPANSEVEISRVNASDFFEQNTLLQFGIDYKEISLVNLVNYKDVRNFLTKSQDALDNGRSDESIENVAYAFYELLHAYESNKSQWGNSPFSFGKSMGFMSSSHLGINRNSDTFKRELGDFVDKVKDSIESLQLAVKITSIGIDYREYVKFNILTPRVYRDSNGKMSAQIMGNK